MHSTIFGPGKQMMIRLPHAQGAINKNQIRQESQSPQVTTLFPDISN
jgi:hypothetical protein